MDNIIEFRGKKQSITAWQQETGINRKTISCRLKSGWSVKDALTKEPYESYSTYKLNARFFHNIDSEIKAYWLGFIAADGGISLVDENRPHSKLKVNLNKRDKSHLEKMLKHFDSTHPIKYRNSTNSSCVMISNKMFVEGLTKNGLMPNKVESLRWPTHIDIDLQQHYLRGYFDGDGCFSMKKGKWPQGYVSLLGNFDFLNGMQSFLNERCGFPANIKLLPCGKSKVTGVIQWGGNGRFRTFGEFIYNNSTVFLDRKREKYLKIRKFCPVKREASCQ